ncbi:DUF2974 domain-containing protein [Carnobacteriaceae bacterium zg-ZUI78]|nr:DUF2974 domain-containing protein [Carnobacteriaceae bacterium zg-ZUI78]
MVPDSDFRSLADIVYHVDKRKKGKKRVDIGDMLILYQTYQVLDIQDNQENGMQAMAVSPLNDYERIVIAYAGTNTDDIHDTNTDVQSFINGNDALLVTYQKDWHYPYVTTSQFQTALSFQKRIKEHFPNATITTTGHSLGQSLAMYVALKCGYMNIGFNGPDISPLISKQEIAYMRMYKEQFKNYRNPYDVIGNITGNQTGTAIYIDYGISSHAHDLNMWQFNDENQLINKQGQTMTVFQTPYLQELIHLHVLSGKFAQSGLSSEEYVFLDTQQASIIAKGIKNIVQEAYMGIEMLTRRYEQRVVDEWHGLLSKSFRHGLSYDEIVECYQENGVTYQTIVEDLSMFFKNKQIQYQRFQEECVLLEHAIQKGIQEKVAQDAQFTGVFK